MDASAFAGAGLIGGLVGIVIVIVIAAVVLMLAARMVLGGFPSLGNAAVVVIVTGIANWAVTFAVTAVAAMAPALAALASILQLVLCVIVDVAIYGRLLEANGNKPSFAQGLFIWLIQLVIWVILAVVIVALAMTVFHTTIPGMPDLSQYMNQ